MDQQYKGTDIKEVATFVQALTERAVKAEHANELPHIFSANGEDYIWRGNMYQKMPEANPKPVRTPDTFIAYTLDGGKPGEIEYENFNAASADLTVHGLSIHPGSAKDKMKNALLLGIEFNGYRYK